MDKIKIFLGLTIGLLFIGAGYNHDPSFTGTITYERKINMYKIYDQMGDWGQRLKERRDKYDIQKFQLEFTNQKSLYKPAESLDRGWGSMSSMNNIVYKDFETNMTISQKNVFDKEFLLNDSFRDFTWTITNEFYEIAGYRCRKATTIIMDSVYIIAFYTPALAVSSGPESIQGLPGMVLGAVFPRLNTQIFANKVSLDANAKNIIAPSDGKKSTTKDMHQLVNEKLKNWGKSYVQRSIWFSGI